MNRILDNSLNLNHMNALASLMRHETHPFEFYLDYWLDCPIEGIASEAELRALYDRQTVVLQ